MFLDRVVSFWSATSVCVCVGVCCHIVGLSQACLLYSLAAPVPASAAPQQRQEDVLGPWGWLDVAMWHACMFVCIRLCFCMWMSSTMERGVEPARDMFARL